MFLVFYFRLLGIPVLVCHANLMQHPASHMILKIVFLEFTRLTLIIVHVILDIVSLSQPNKRAYAVPVHKFNQ